jgi:uncharacterized protein
MFRILIAHDVPDGAALRAATKLVHKAYLDTPPEGIEVLLSGPMLDESEREMGSVIVFRAADEAQLRAYLADEPYQQAGLFARTELRGWTWRRGNPYI